MKRYSITKYHKDTCDSEEEWTSVSDIGKVYNGNVLNIMCFIVSLLKQ